ncbi:HD domain-containing phosphohydrolase [Photobacterium angustum]|uniref:ABC transporter substrate-binding protein n=1 Tax=Photobacterium angustum TaxID=661 RepID=A0A855SM46_PHOAN|nr:HD domain-containing phosphohydrolase [Photobacterium angustum]PSX09998.1 ABC transporter substrate-binding protein [Photobacterium angustum]PSX16757.1 ABC transporter substrate-binding protein [Photobacterium angustum]PSX24628.1 ABC transporter substrate-binding protein [Photobacterium angustum]PSX40994.1 ABC transporter substrate-binding protein [Photobacterium angustum]
MKASFSLRKIIIGTFLATSTLTALLAIFLQYQNSKEIVKNNVLIQYNQAANSISNKVSELHLKAQNSIDLISHYAELTESISPKKLLPFFRKMLEQNKDFYQVYIANKDADFMLINLKSSQENSDDFRLAYWKSVLRYTGNNRFQIVTYYDENMRVIDSRHSIINAMDAENRVWFKNSNKSKVFKSDPYLFLPMQQPGITYAREVKNKNTKTVVGIDILVARLSNMIKQENMLHGIETYLFSDAKVIASNNSKSLEYADKYSNVKKIEFKEEEKKYLSSHPILRVSNEDDWAPYDYIRSGIPRGYSIDYINILSKLIGVEINYINGNSWSELVALFKQNKIDVLNSVSKTEHNKNVALFSDPIGRIHLGLASLKSNNYKSIDEILKNTKNVNIAILEDSSLHNILTDKYPTISIKEYSDVNVAMDSLLRDEIDAYLDDISVLTYFKQQYHFYDVANNKTDLVGYSGDKIRLAVSNNNEVLHGILNKAIKKFPITILDRINKEWLSMDATVGKDSVLPYKELSEMAYNKSYYDHLEPRFIDGEKLYFYVTPITNKKNDTFLGVVAPADVLYSEAIHDLKMSVLVILGLLISIILPVVMLIGFYLTNSLNQLRNETKKITQKKYDDVKLVHSYTKEISELSSSIYSLAHDVKKHEKEMNSFVDSFIHVIASAIDDKSPYTAGHCNRVPEIAILIAEAAHNYPSGLFADFKFKNDQEKREFSIAAWLHDCGKITTPEYIVDKGTKLESVNNRIHEIRTRFEVLWRDAEIQYLKNVLTDSSQEKTFAQELKLKRQELHDDFAFIAQSNVGSEFMSDEDIERIYQLAEIKWMRNFDDTIGLSPVEELRVGKVNCNVYPIEEKLLMDRPDHRIERIQEFHVDPAFAIKMDVPELLYDLGEIHNLTIRRGTLTAEDRFKINEHMISTIKILEKIPFPKSLANVPRYASTHHETMKGSGYPRKLSAEDLSIPERIIAVADVFEALTAADRPYKKAKPVSVAIDILHKMALDNLLDLAVFKLFIKSGVYKVYADKYLPEEQNDLVDISKYL